MRFASHCTVKHMAEFNELDLDQLDNEIENNNRTEKRFKDLSSKVKLTAEELDEQKRLVQDRESKISELEKERDFFNSFGDQIAKFPEAAGYKEQIKERVLRGYSVDDAVAAVLVSNGKYNAPVQTQPVANLDTFAGGSSTTVHQMTGEKTIQQLTRDEKRARLMEAEARGDISAN